MPTTNGVGEVQLVLNGKSGVEFKGFCSQLKYGDCIGPFFAGTQPLVVQVNANSPCTDGSPRVSVQIPAPLLQFSREERLLFSNYICVLSLK